MSSRARTAAWPERGVLVLLDGKTTAALPDRVAALERDGAILKIVDYSRLMSQVEAIRRIVHERQIDFVLFSRNNQVFDKVNIGPVIRALGVGYSSFSGIDSEQALEQTTDCLDDYLAGGSELTLIDRKGARSSQNHATGTFSLLFDLEQLGGARFGLPRILGLLDQYGATATFFTTNFIHQVYTNVLEIISRRGHEVGLHGQYHEYLAGQPLDQQISMIQAMKRDFESSGPSIRGANFIGRMDATTLRAMVACGLEYFVEVMEHRYSPFAYRKMPVRPLSAWSPQGTMWMVPISTETNNRPWFAVKNMIDSALLAGRSEGWSHVNILLHPFRDGSLRHIGNLKRLLDYLQGTVGYRSVTVADSLKQLRRWEPSSFIYYPFSSVGRTPVSNGIWQSWWYHTPRYQQRICNLYQALARNAGRPALCVSFPPKGKRYAVYPHLPEGVAQIGPIKADPLLFTQETSSPSFVNDNDQNHTVYAMLPTSWENDLKNAVRISRPRFPQDYTALFPETALRLAYRLSPGRQIF